MPRGELRLSPPGESVRVEWDRESSGAIARMLASGPRERPVSVTELLDPRPAFHRRLHPVPVSPERRARMEAGRTRHERSERLLALPSHREIRLLREGIVGRVDILDDFPTEIKSSGAIPSVERLAEERPQYLDQLGMYCALVDRPVGRLILLPLDEEESSVVAAVDAEFRDLPEVLRRMRSSASLFRSALARGEPAELPRCGWFDRGCEFQEAGACGCRGSEPTPSEPVHELLVRCAPAPPGFLAQLLRRLSEPATGAPEPVHRFRDLLYPKQAYFERTGAPRAPGATGPRIDAGEQGPSLYARLRDAIDTGELGGAGRESPPGGLPEEAVPLFRGDPILIKTSQVRWPPAPEALVERQPHYILELGLRCAALARPEGWLLVGYERVEPPQDAIRLLRVRYDPLEPWREELRSRAGALRAALERSDPSALPACPEWMFERCPYRALCGDGPAAGAAGPR